MEERAIIESVLKIVLQNVELPNAELQNAEKKQNAELQNADYKTLKVTKDRLTKRRITKRRSYKRWKNKRSKVTKHYKKPKKKVENWGTVYRKAARIRIRLGMRGRCSQLWGDNRRLGLAPWAKPNLRPNPVSQLFICVCIYSNPPRPFSSKQCNR